MHKRVEKRLGPPVSRIPPPTPLITGKFFCKVKFFLLDCHLFSSILQSLPSASPFLYVSPTSIQSIHPPSVTHWVNKSIPHDLNPQESWKRMMKKKKKKNSTFLYFSLHDYFELIIHYNDVATKRNCTTFSETSDL